MRNGFSPGGSSGFHFEKNFHHDWYSEWKASDAKNHSHRKLVLPKDIAQQFGSTISHLWMRKEGLVGSQVRSELDHSG